MPGPSAKGRERQSDAKQLTEGVRQAGRPPLHGATTDYAIAVYEANSARHTGSKSGRCGRPPFSSPRIAKNALPLIAIGRYIRPALRTVPRLKPVTRKRGSRVRRLLHAVL